jgi:3-deoxy-manno-octulosonate cytidylyltransferase (CMP-KDO synthetase)
MAVLLVIPARYASTRYPGKALAELRGATGQARSLIRRSWDAAMAVPGVDRVVVATDDDRIADAAEGFGAEVAMTPDTCRNGTERCAVVAAELGDGFDVVVNLQGDAPLTPPWFVSALIDAMNADPARQVATPVLRCDADALAGFIEDRRHGRVGATTAVFDRDDRGEAYCQRRPGARRQPSRLGTLSRPSRRPCGRRGSRRRRALRSHGRARHRRG